MDRKTFVASIGAAIASAADAEALDVQELQPGKMYVLESPQALHVEALRSIRKMGDEIEKKYGIKIVAVLEDGLRIRDLAQPMVNITINLPS
jgi:hypothetical protein